jgi:hypothetical protein
MGLLGAAFFSWMAAAALGVVLFIWFFLENIQPTLKPLHKKIGWITLAVVVILAILLLLAILPLAFLVGRGEAMSQQDFLVTFTNPSMPPDTVVLRIYGDKMVCASFDFEKREVTKTFFVLKLDDEPRPKIYLAKVGPLKVKSVWIPKQ